MPIPDDTPPPCGHDSPYCHECWTHLQEGYARGYHTGVRDDKRRVLSLIREMCVHMGPPEEGLCPECSTLAVKVADLEEPVYLTGRGVPTDLYDLGDKT